MFKKNGWVEAMRNVRGEAVYRNVSPHVVGEGVGRGNKKISNSLLGVTSGRWCRAGISGKGGYKAGGERKECLVKRVGRGRGDIFLAA